MAGPLDRLSIQNWIIDLSEIIPAIPPRASISRTICPLATPPIAGLHDICPMVFMFMGLITTKALIFIGAAIMIVSLYSWLLSPLEPEHH